jgi:hypothetical protein
MPVSIERDRRRRTAPLRQRARSDIDGSIQDVAHLSGANPFVADQNRVRYSANGEKGQGWRSMPIDPAAHLIMAIHA